MAFGLVRFQTYIVVGVRNSDSAAFPSGVGLAMGSSSSRSASDDQRNGSAVAGAADRQPTSASRRSSFRFHSEVSIRSGRGLEVVSESLTMVWCDVCHGRRCIEREGCLSGELSFFILSVMYSALTLLPGDKMVADTSSLWLKATETVNRERED